MSARRLGSLCLLISVISAQGADADQMVYWTDRSTGSIHRCALDGSSSENILQGLPGPQGIAVDDRGGRIFWADSTVLAIQSAELDGSDIRTVATLPLFIPVGVEFDEVSRKVYWTDPVFGDIYRCNPDGDHLEVVLDGLAGPQDIWVSGRTSRMFWASGPGGIQTASLDGSSMTDLLEEFSGNVIGVASSPLEDKIVWISGDRFRLVPLSGGTEQVLNPLLGQCRSIARDAFSQTYYWIDADTNSIMSMQADLSPPTPVVTGMGIPWRLDIGPALSPPTIISSPASVVAASQSSALFSVTAIGSQTLHYQWRLNESQLSDNARISGTSSPTLAISAVQRSDTGSYDCIITNAAGQVITPPAVLGVTFCDGDADGNGQVNIEDLNQVLGNFGEPCPVGPSRP